jgi:hypothetical protein
MPEVLEVVYSNAAIFIHVEAKFWLEAKWKDWSSQTGTGDAGTEEPWPGRGLC